MLQAKVESWIRWLDGGRFRVFFGALLFFLAVNLTHLSDPPYWDAIVGVFRQAIWLSENQLNYNQLLQQAPAFDGGPLISRFYAWSFLIAALYLVLPPKGVFVVMHLLTQLLAAGTIALGYRLIRQHTEATVALLWVLMAAAEPIFSGQTAAMYMEVPTALLYMVVLHLALNGRFVAAAAACFFTMFIKLSALLLACVLGLWVLVSWFLDRKINWSQLVLWLPAPAIWGLAFHRLDSSTGWGLDVLAARFVARSLPTIWPSLLLAVVFLAIAGVRLLRRDREPALALLAMLVGAFWCSYFLYALPVPRYSAAVVVPLACLGALGLRDLARPIQLAVPLVVLSFFVVNQQGALMPSIPPQLARSGDWLERSREWLVDLRANQELCRYLETNHADERMLARWPIVHMLTIPKMGYVDSPLKVLTHSPLNTETVLVYDPEVDSPFGKVMVHSPTTMEYRLDPSYAPIAGDIELWADESVPGRVTVVRRPVP